MRFPRSGEVFLGVSMSIVVWFFILSPLKIQWPLHWMPGMAVLATSAISILLAMKMNDVQRKSRTVREAAVADPDEAGFVTVSCPGVGCEGSVSVRPPKEEDLYVRCPRCGMALGVGLDSRGRVVGYASREIP